mmetsp:Transcript_3787/g.9046  ORF Transcript_3787/g.9046 Transcript_3787/m.9046 type:complete len:117 (-) Transcript_3787:235-585(-)
MSNPSKQQPNNNIERSTQSIQSTIRPTTCTRPSMTLELHSLASILLTVNNRRHRNDNTLAFLHPSYGFLLFSKTDSSVLPKHTFNLERILASPSFLPSFAADHHFITVLHLLTIAT